MKKPYENYNKNVSNLAEGLSNCEVSPGQYQRFCLRRGHYPYMNNAYAAICLWSESNPNDSVKVALSQNQR